MKPPMCIETIPVFPHPNISHVYRVRVASDFDKTEPTEFGYIQDKTKISRQRLNKEGEQVLYTSSYPTIAERETIEEAKDFFLTKFKKKDSQDNFLSFVAIDDNCSINPNSASRQLRNDILEHISEDDLNCIDFLRNILEKDYNKDDINKYIESSECASKILEVANCIITYSKVGDDGNMFLNLTFNKYAADNLLEIETIYHCKAKKDQSSMEYDIIEIGLPVGNKIKWFDYEIDKDSVQIENKGGYILSNEDIMRKYDRRIMPSVNADINNLFSKKIILPNFGEYILRTSFNLIDKQQS